MTQYYECHVTIEPVFDARLEQVEQLVKPYHFKVADLLMKKRETDTAVRSDKDTFTTGHDLDYDSLERRMLALIHDLQQAGFVVWRYKIEHVLLDSRSKDLHNVLK